MARGLNRVWVVIKITGFVIAYTVFTKENRGFMKILEVFRKLRK